MARDRVTVDVGGDHPFWDVHLPDDVYERAGIERDAMPHISVDIEDGGALCLNAGYDTRSREYGMERELFDTARDEITDALVEEIRRRFPDESCYTAFLDQNGPALSVGM